MKNEEAKTKDGDNNKQNRTRNKIATTPVDK